MAPETDPAYPPAGDLGAPDAGLLRALLASVADAVYVVDAAGVVRYANPAALEVLGFPAEELLGRPSHATIHHTRPDGTVFPEEDCPLLRPRTTGETVRVEEDWFVRRDGTLAPVSYSSAPFPTAGGRGAVVAFRDETTRREDEETRRREAVERARADAVEASRARILAAADDERRRLGRDLHDGAQQRLMTVAMRVGRGLRELDADPAAARRTLTGAVDEARATLADLRELAAGIHPSILTNRGLAAAIESLTSRAPLPVTVAIPDDRLPAGVEATAYFAIAEALANVAKHAGATGAEVRTTLGDGTLRVEVRDDGRGGADPAGGGLRGLRDRVEALGGALAVGDDPAGGTLLVATLPVEG